MSGKNWLTFDCPHFIRQDMVWVCIVAYQRSKFLFGPCLGVKKGSLAGPKPPDTSMVWRSRQIFFVWNKGSFKYYVIRLGGWGVWTKMMKMMTQHNKVAGEMIHHPLLMICIFIVTLLASTNLSITAPFIAGLSLGPSWAVADSIFSWSVRPTSRSEEGRIGLSPRHPHSSITSSD